MIIANVYNKFCDHRVQFRPRYNYDTSKEGN